MTTATATRTPAHTEHLARIAAAGQAMAEAVGENEERRSAVEALRRAWSGAMKFSEFAESLADYAQTTKIEWEEADAAARRPARVEVPEGMHQYGGHIWKVQESPSTGRRYAKVLEESFGSERGWVFTYVPGAIRNLSERTLLSLEEAKEFGVLYGTCCVCARTLTNEDSIAAGIGPICAGKF